jgi:mRNA-degrading endonuclease RelE of RelBE toxin-antitoxin system
MLSIFYHPKVKKDLKSLDKAVAHEIVTSVIPSVSEHLENGIKLSGELKNFYKFSFHVKGISYRIIYELSKSENKNLYILFIGPRENAYEKVLRRL